MTGRRRRVAIASFLTLAMAPAVAGPVVAQQPDRPFVVPQRDVDVLYAIPAAGLAPAVAADPAAGSAASAVAAVAQRVRFAADPARQRVDPPGSGTYMITDYAARRLTVVQPGQRTATMLPAPGTPLAPHGVRADGAYRRLDSHVVAGTSCTDWSTRDQAGAESVVCLTDDGVMLQASQAGRLLLQAVRVSYAPQPAAVFAVPDGYRVQVAPTG